MRDLGANSSWQISHCLAQMKIGKFWEGGILGQRWWWWDWWLVGLIYHQLFVDSSLSPAPAPAHQIWRIIASDWKVDRGVFSRGWTVTSRSKIWTFLLVVSSLAIHPSSTSSLGLAWIYPGLSVGGVDLRINCTVVGSTFGLHPLTNLNLVDR